MAFGKELYDHIDHKAWSNADAFATCLGGVCAFIGIFCWDFITTKLPFTVY